MLSEVSRVLSNEGVFIVVSYGEEKKRTALLENVSIKGGGGISCTDRKLSNSPCQPEFMWSVKKVYKIYKPNVNT